MKKTEDVRLQEFKLPDLSEVENKKEEMWIKIAGSFLVGMTALSIQYALQCMLMF